MRQIFRSAAVVFLLAALFASAPGPLFAQAGPPAVPNEGSVKDGVYTHPGAGFQFTLPASWLAYGYKWYEAKGVAATLANPRSQYVVDWVYASKDPGVTEYSLLRFIVYNRADWLSISAEPGPPVGELVGQSANYSYVAAFPQANPFDHDSDDGREYDSMVLNRAYVRGAFRVLTPSTDIQPVAPVAEWCRFAGSGATFAVQDQRVNFTCVSNDGEAALFGNISSGPDRWSIGRAVIVQDRGRPVPASTSQVSVLGIELADGLRCFWTGPNAPRLVDGKMAYFTCSAPGTRIYALIGEVQAVDRGWAVQRIELIPGIAGFSAGAADIPLIASLGVGAPRPIAPPSNQDLTGSTWNWAGTTTADGQRLTPDDPTKYQITFLADGRFGIRADCNVGGGTYASSGSQFSMKLGPMTLVACLPESLGVEFTRQVGGVVYLSRESGRLLLQIGDEGGTMSFVSNDAVTGTLTYRERIALPDDALIRVQLLDVSRAGAPPVVVSDQIIAAEGKQVPFEFSLPYFPGDIRENGQYSVKIEIRASDGRLLFVTDSANLVITNGRPTRLDLVLVRTA